MGIVDSRAHSGAHRTIASALGALPQAPLVVEFAGERVEVPRFGVFAIGRHGDLVIDDNRYLHRRFLELSAENGMWWLSNVGSRLAAIVTDGSGRVHVRLAPGARVPVTSARLDVLFTAGSTSYDLTLHCADDYATEAVPRSEPVGEDTIGAVPLSASQRLLVVALAENALRQAETGHGEIPSSADAAARLGWTLTAFTRKLDTVCAKLAREGVPGLRGGRGNLATNRRSRLVEHAVATRLVTRDDLALLADARVSPGTPRAVAPSR